MTKHLPAATRCSLPTAYHSPFKVEKEKERYGKLSEQLIAADVQFKLNDKWVLKPDSACYQASMSTARSLPTPTYSPPTHCTLTAHSLYMRGMFTAQSMVDQVFQPVLPLGIF